MASILKLDLYPRLASNSRRALTRVRKKWGWPVQYSPRPQLVERLAREMQWPQSKVIETLHEERRLLIANPGALVYAKFDEE